MKIKKILALLFLVATIVVQGQLVAFAAEPPGVDSPFGDTDDDTSPPALEGGDTDDDTSPPALEGGAADDDDTSGGATDDDGDTSADTDTSSADSADTGSGSADAGSDSESQLALVNDDATAETAGGTSGYSESTNIISESGPGVAFLLIPSLILGYAYKKMPKK